MKFIQFLITTFVIKQCFCDEIPKVNLKQGVLLGTVEKTIYKKQDYFSFRGIPFAEPPTGALRFKPPIPHTGWNKNIKAFKNKPTCMQLNTRGRLREPLGKSGSEDCLYINIFTPNILGKAPIVVFEYNDNFRTWFNGTDTYSPDFFIEEGVIVVTISSRLGIFGYLTTEDNVIPGNNGLRDFILGLKWIKDNIEEFGGDASKITLMGSRGGAATVDILLHSEKAKGLFSGAILQSGSSLEAMYFIDEPRKKAFDIGNFLNLTASNSDELLKELQNIDADKIVNADIGLIMRLGDNELDNANKIFFVPTIESNTEDAVIKCLPEKGNIVNDVPVILGFNSREGADLISHLLIEPRLLTNNTEKQIFQLPIRTEFTFVPNSGKYKEANRAVLDFYYKDKSLHYGNLMEHATYVGDVLHVYPLSLTADKLARSLSSAVFFYVFDFRGLWNQNSEELARGSRFPLGNSGALVLDELCYFFVCTRLKKTYENLMNLPSKQPELKVMSKLTRLWSNFAKTGNPTPNQDDPILSKLKWEPFSNKTDSNFLYITKKLQMKKNPMGKRKTFWDELLEKYAKEAVVGVVQDDEATNEETLHEEVVAEEVPDIVSDTEQVHDDQVINEKLLEEGVGVRIVNNPDEVIHDEF